MKPHTSLAIGLDDNAFTQIRQVFEHLFSIDWRLPVLPTLDPLQLSEKSEEVYLVNRQEDTASMIRIKAGARNGRIFYHSKCQVATTKCNGAKVFIKWFKCSLKQSKLTGVFTVLEIQAPHLGSSEDPVDLNHPDLKSWEQSFLLGQQDDEIGDVREYFDAERRYDRILRIQTTLYTKSYADVFKDHNPFCQYSVSTRTNSAKESFTLSLVSKDHCEFN